MNNICPYCNGKILYSKSSKMIYGKDYGGIYYCENFPICNSYVGVHKNTKKSEKVMFIILIILSIIGLTVKWKNNTYKNVFWVFILLSFLSQIAKYLYLYGIIK